MLLELMPRSRRCNSRVVPTDGATRFARAIPVDVDDERHFEPWGVRRLRQEHRAELAGPDQRNADRFAGGIADVEEVGEIHEGDPVAT